jgi:hypothetical protein
LSCLNLLATSLQLKDNPHAPACLTKAYTDGWHCNGHHSLPDCLLQSKNGPQICSDQSHPHHGGGYTCNDPPSLQNGVRGTLCLVATATQHAAEGGSMLQHCTNSTVCLAAVVAVGQGRCAGVHETDGPHTKPPRHKMLCSWLHQSSWAIQHLTPHTKIKPRGRHTACICLDWRP